MIKRKLSGQRLLILRVATAFLAVFLGVGLILSALPVYADEGDGTTVDVGQGDGGAVVQVDKPDYAFWETPTISGSGFTPDNVVNLSVTAPDGTVTNFTALTDSQGQFVTTYTGPMGAGDFQISATDGANTAATTFADAYLYITDFYSADGGAVAKDIFTVGDDVYVVFHVQKFGPGGATPIDLDLYVVPDMMWLAWLPGVEASAGTESYSSIPEGWWYAPVALAGELAAGDYDIVADYMGPGGPNEWWTSFGMFWEAVDAFGVPGFTVTGAPIQYYLTVNSNLPGGVSPVPNPLGWGNYPAGAIAYASMNEYCFYDTPFPSTAWTFAQWLIDGVPDGTNYALSDAILMDADHTADATWDTWYWLWVNSAYDTPYGEGWYQAKGIAQPYLTDGVDGDWQFAYWAGDASGTSLVSTPIPMDGPKNADAVWIYTPPGSAVPGGVTYGWFGAGGLFPVDPLFRTLGDVMIEGANPDDPMLLLGAGTAVGGFTGGAHVEGALAGTPAPPEGASIVYAYQFTPSGVTFNPAAQVVITYNPDDVPEGSVLVIAYYDEALGQWVEVDTAGYVLGGEAVPNALVGDVAHFTYFALLAK